MKYPGGNTSTLFCEQVGTVTSLFEQWNDCERTVVLYALLKRVPFANLKFLQLSIEYNLAQNYNSQTNLHVIENNSNNAVFLTKLINTYKNFKCCKTSSANESQSQTQSTTIFKKEKTNNNKNKVIYENINDTSLNNSTTQPQHYTDNLNCFKYDKKEDILNDILVYLPLLKPGNNEAKSVFLSLIPCVVEDSVRQIVPIELVQQILSYLLIHPAILNEDRRSLSQWLRHLEDHISQSYSNPIVQNKAPNYFGIPSESTSPASTISTTWQAVAPPISQTKHIHDNSSWDMKTITVTQEFCDEIKINDFHKAIGKKIDFNNTIGSNSTQSKSSSNTMLSAYDTSNDDHHVSFSKNGTDVLEYDGDDYDKSNTQIAFDPISSTSVVHDFLMVPNFIESNALKTRRSNSLTTTTTVSQNIITSSSENLASILQKPRSFSLSMESPRSSLTSSGSETRLDDYKPNYMKFSSCYAGMGNIGQWLKSLRLHKYIWLFSNMSYEQMLEISETYLENVGVTKGARNKLVLCIQKLKERSIILNQIRKDIAKGQYSLNGILEELSNMVLTPMKPADPYIKDDVAGLLLVVLDIVTKILTTKPINQADEDNINSLTVVLDRALQSEGFTASSDLMQLKEHKFKVSKLKLQFTPKSHYVKTNGSGNGLNKQRWNNGGSKQHKSSNNDKPQRKLSGFSINQNQQNHLQQLHQYQEKCQQQQQSNNNKSASFYQPTLQNNNSTSNNYNKSSSYPNFTSTTSSSTTTSNHSSNNCKTKSLQQQHSPGISNSVSGNSNGIISNGVGNINGVTNAVHNGSNNYHRHSLNNISLAPILTQSATVLTAPLISTMCSPTTPQNATATTTIQPPSAVTQQQQQQQQILVNNRLNSKDSKRTCNNTKEAIIEPPIVNNCNNLILNNNNNNHNNNNINYSKTTTTNCSINNSQINSKSQKSSIGDINSRLEFLCLQMTEQAIN